MATKAPKDTVLFFRAEGDDAEQSLEALVALVARDFDEEHAGTTGLTAHAGAD